MSEKKYRFDVIGFCHGCKKEMLGMRSCPQECFYVHFYKLMKKPFKQAFEKMYLASGCQFNKFYFFDKAGQGVLIEVTDVGDKKK